ncbi:MAG: hypothetical protein WD851_08610 [Pirellulales bacterium]
MSENLSSTVHRICWIRRLTGLFLLLLIGSTWRLWTPHASVPSVPAFAPLASLPTALDWVLFASVLVAVTAWTLSRRFTHVAGGVLLACLALLLALDQLRWQPWAVQAWLFVAVIALTEPPRALLLLRWLTIGIYFHSAIAKLDYEFATTLGQQFLATLLGFVAVPIDDIPENVRIRLALLFPIAELLVAALLCFRRTANVGVIAAVVMHLTTIAIIGPWGLAHQAGVLVWNLWLAVQTPVLFWPAGTTSHEEKAVSSPQWGDRIATALVLAAILLPFTTRFGGWDTWPSWALYAPGAERSIVWVHELAVVRFPPSIQQHVRGEESWRQLHLDRWVLSELGAPLYPQNRARFALASAIADRHQLGDLIRVQFDSPANRWTGERQSRLIQNRREFLEQRESYWLNASPTP